MSLINKMLQDLDARGVKDGAALQPDIRAAAVSERSLPRRQVVIAASALTVCAAVAGYIWLRQPAPAAPPVAVLAAPVAVPAPAVGAPAPSAPVTAAEPVRVGAIKSVPASSTRADNTPSPAFAAPPERKPAADRVTASVPVESRQRAERAAAAAPMAEMPVPRQRGRGTRHVAQEGTPRMERPASAPQSALPAPVSGGREVTVPPRAENAYRQALASLDEGKVSTAYAALEQALKLNPRHDAARQSLVSLLIEDGRNDEAMQQLEQGLAADAGQPSLAMLLARMQIERGVSGVATLQRSLPAAAGNADYHAFLAGALQREQRHREAIDQYAAALRISPNHGVWLMGMGISLQAEKRLREATEAFTRAKASGMLTPALETFVERKLQQLPQ